MKIDELRQGVLLMGQPGLLMLEDAVAAAKDYLSVTYLEAHPDYFFISAREGKKTIGVDDVNVLVERSFLRPSIAQKQVCIINGIDSMTIQAQNKILKVIEECETVVILAVAYSNYVLDTVKSRLSLIEYKPLSLEEFKNILPIRYQSDLEADLLYRITRGCPGNLDVVLSYYNNFVKVVRDVRMGLAKNLLCDLHLLKEKDSESVVDAKLVFETIQLLEYVFTEQLLLLEMPKENLSSTSVNPNYKRENLVKTINLLAEHKTLCKKVSYSKDNFFFLIASIIMINKED